MIRYRRGDILDARRLWQWWPGLDAGRATHGRVVPQVPAAQV
jgi:hypothetical protein